MEQNCLCINTIHVSGTWWHKFLWKPSLSRGDVPHLAWMNVMPTSNSPNFEKVTPQFSKVREVWLVEHMYASSTEENMVLHNAINLECSCGYFSWFGITYRHIFSVISPQGHSFDFGTLSAYHASARWRKDYLCHHGKHDKLTLLYDCAREWRTTWSLFKKGEDWWTVASEFCFGRAHSVSPRSQPELYFCIVTRFKVGAAN